MAFRLKSKKLHTVKFAIDAAAPDLGVLVPLGETATVRVPAGLPNTSGTTGVGWERTVRCTGRLTQRWADVERVRCAAPKTIYRPKPKRGAADAGAGADADSGKYGQSGAPSWSNSVTPPLPRYVRQWAAQ